MKRFSQQITQAENGPIPGDAYSAALYNDPEATLTLTGIVLGAMGGALAAWGISGLVKPQDTTAWVFGGAALGSAVLGWAGYSNGQELSAWWTQQTQPASAPGTAPLPSVDNSGDSVSV